MSKLQILKVYISQRLFAAVDDILGHLEMTILEYEEETESRHRGFSAEVEHQGGGVPPDAPETEQPPPQQQLDKSSSVANETPHPEPPLIKTEQQETRITKATFGHICVKNEEDEEEAQSSQLNNKQTEENIVTLEGEGCGEPELTVDYLSPDYNDPKSELRVEDFNATREAYSGAESSNHLNTGSNNSNAFQCSECGKIFNSPRYLKTHIRCNTTSEKPFRCPVCRKCFPYRHSLLKHTRIHTGEKPFRCSVCGKMFSESGNMKVHMRIHTGEKPFICSICGKAYAQNWPLKNHMEVHKSDSIQMQSSSIFSVSSRPESAANLNTKGLRRYKYSFRLPMTSLAEVNSMEPTESRYPGSHGTPPTSELLPQQQPRLRTAWSSGTPQLPPESLMLT